MLTYTLAEKRWNKLFKAVGEKYQCSEQKSVPTLKLFRYFNLILFLFLCGLLFKIRKGKVSRTRNSQIDLENNIKAQLVLRIAFFMQGITHSLGQL